MIGIEHAAHNCLADAEAAGEFGVGDLVFAHGKIEGQLAGDPQRHRNKALATLQLRGSRDRSTIRDPGRDYTAKAIDGFLEGFGKICAVCMGTWEVRETHKQPATLVWLKLSWVSER